MKTFSPKHSAYLLQSLGHDSELRGANSGNLIDHHKPGWQQLRNETVESFARKVFTRIFRIRMKDAINGSRPRAKMAAATPEKATVNTALKS